MLTNNNIPEVTESVKKHGKIKNGLSKRRKAIKWMAKNGVKLGGLAFFIGAFGFFTVTVCIMPVAMSLTPVLILLAIAAATIVIPVIIGCLAGFCQWLDKHLTKKEWQQANQNENMQLTNSSNDRIHKKLLDKQDQTEKSVKNDNDTNANSSSPILTNNNNNLTDLFKDRQTLRSNSGECTSSSSYSTLSL